jgi:hypothetical protein
MQRGLLLISFALLISLLLTASEGKEEDGGGCEEIVGLRRGEVDLRKETYSCLVLRNCEDVLVKGINR